MLTRKKLYRLVFDKNIYRYYLFSYQQNWSIVKKLIVKNFSSTINRYTFFLVSKINRKTIFLSRNNRKIFLLSNNNRNTCFWHKLINIIFFFCQIIIKIFLFLSAKLNDKQFSCQKIIEKFVLFKNSFLIVFSCQQN